MGTLRKRQEDLDRIEGALLVADEVLRSFLPGAIESSQKSNSDPVTEADLVLDHTLRELLLEPGEGWLSEETADSADRLAKDRIWVVDPLDGTKEFVAGIPEWCVAIGLVENGTAVAGGILNPAVGFLALGAEGLGCTLNGRPANHKAPSMGEYPTVLASRSEVGRGEWRRWGGTSFHIEPMGSVAYKLARVACGLAHATWTLVPKHEWDIAAGTALVSASGGLVCLPGGGAVKFNQLIPRVSGLIAFGNGALPTFEADDLAYLLPGPDRENNAFYSD